MYYTEKDERWYWLYYSNKNIYQKIFKKKPGIKLDKGFY